MTNVLTTIKSARDTEIGKLLDVDNNATWLLYIAYSVPHVMVDLPALCSVTAPSTSPEKNVTELVASITSSADALKQMEDKSLDEAYLLAQRDVDKLAIAVYTLYLYGRR